MIPKFSIFEDSSSNVLLQQLELLSSRDVEPTRPKLSEPMSRLYDECEAILASGRATSVSEALAIIGKTDPAAIDSAAAIKTALESAPIDTAERRYRAAIEQAKSTKNLSFEAAQTFINRSRPDLREAFCAEVNARRAQFGPVGAKVSTATRAYWSKVDELAKSKGLTRAQAMQRVNKFHSDLRTAMVKEINS